MKFGIVFLITVLISCISYTQDGVFNELSFKCSDGVDRPYILYTPNTINKNNKRPLLTYLHGAISSKKLKKDPLVYIKKSPLLKLADKGGFYLLFCYGQKGATWFDNIGVNMVINEVETVKKDYNIDKEKIFLSGFSDGGSGVMYIAMTKPNIFAGFISMNGHLRVAVQLGESQVYPENMNDKPFFIINTKGDLLYPSKKLYPIIETIKSNNSNVKFTDIDGNHDMSYLKYLDKDIIKFIEKNSKKKLYNISWQCSKLTANTIEWITIKKIDTSQIAKQWHTNYSLNLFEDKADFGIKYDYKYQGKGLKILGFKNNKSTAKKMKLKVGDIVYKMENDTIKNAYSPYYYMAKKKAGDKTSITALRDNKLLKFDGKFNKGYSYELFKHKSKSAKVKANYRAKVITIETSCVSELAIDFNKLSINSSKEIVVKINNKSYRVIPKGIQTFSSIN